MGTGAPGWAGTVVLGDGILVYLGPGSRVGRHSHDAIQFVRSLGRPFTVEMDSSCSVNATLVASGAAHAIDATEDPLVLVLVEPRGRRGRALRVIADRVQGDEIASVLDTASTPALEHEPAPAQLLEWADDMVAVLIGDDESKRDTSVSAPVGDVLVLVEQMLPETVRLTDAAAAVAVSPSALTHTFTREVGMPFRRYVLWARLRRAAELVQRGADLTSTAATAGFADSAHLSRTFRSPSTSSSSAGSSRGSSTGWPPMRSCTRGSRCS